MKKRFVFQIILMIVLFYIVPWLLFSKYKQDKAAFFILLSALNPFILFVDALFSNMNIRMISLMLLFFVPSIFIFYQGKAWVYAVVYVGLMALGIWIRHQYYKVDEHE